MCHQHDCLVRMVGHDISQGCLGAVANIGQQLAVGEMDSVVQQNAANSEESASFTEEVNIEARKLLRIVEDLQKMVGGNRKTKTDTDPDTAEIEIGRRADSPARESAHSPANYPALLKNETKGKKGSREIAAKQDLLAHDEEFKDF